MVSTAQVEEDGAQTTYSYDENDRLIEANYPLDKIQKIRETYLTPPNSQPGPGQDNGLHKGWDNGNGNSGSGNGNDNDNGSGNGNKHTQSNNFSLFSFDTVKSASLENWFYHIFGHGNGGGGNSGSGGNNNGGGRSNNGGGNGGENGGLNGNAGLNGNGADNGNENGNGNGNNGYGKAFGKDKAKQTKNKFKKTIMEEDLPAYMVKPQSKVQYTYDEAGNRLTMTDDDGTINYYYDDDNRLVSEGGNELNYNDAGNLIQKTDGNGTTNYSYDAAGRLAQVSLADGTSESYGYDAYGKKIFEAETYWQYDGKTKHLRNQTTSSLYQGEKLLKEYTGEGSPLAEYYTANGRVIARNMFGFHDRKTWGNADNIRTRGGLMYYHYDALGNVTDFTDRLGENVVKYRWDAFGGMFAGVLAPYSRMGITGKEYDPKTGQVFFGSRWYNPMVGQFTMPDTYMGQIKNPQSLNAYAYAWNNPVNRIDPTGHWVDNSDGTYTAESGDTLWGLAQETTGNGSNWTDLGYTGTPENLQVGETIGTSSGGTSSGDASYGDTLSGDTSYGDTLSGGTSSKGGGSSGSGYSGGDDYTPPPPPPGGSIPLPAIVNDTNQGTGKAHTNNLNGLIASTDPYFGFDDNYFLEEMRDHPPGTLQPPFCDIVNSNPDDLNFAEKLIYYLLVPPTYVDENGNTQQYALGIMPFGVGGLRRPYIRDSVRTEVEARAPRTSDGRFIDPNTRLPIEGKYDLGHKPGYEFWREKLNAHSEGLTQKQFNDRMNNPDYYQIEDPSSNRGHLYEMD